MSQYLGIHEYEDLKIGPHVVLCQIFDHIYLAQSRPLILRYIDCSPSDKGHLAGNESRRTKRVSSQVIYPY